jgi:hypothetical protein
LTVEAVTKGVASAIDEFCRQKTRRGETRAEQQRRRISTSRDTRALVIHPPSSFLLLCASACSLLTTSWKTHCCGPSCCRQLKPLPVNAVATFTREEEVEFAVIWRMSDERGGTKNDSGTERAQRTSASTKDERRKLAE